MSYVVLARKWRPMTFSDLVGQEHVAKTLGNAIAIGRVAHAFLFTGVRGVGKTTSARILAKALNCVEGPTATPCLKCSPCTEIAGGSDMDVQEIDAASRTGVDDIRDLQETLVYRPSRDRFKIFIVDEVHMLSSSAWNAFLKTLEEPPPHVKFVFATTEVNKVPVTILSRCQRYDFKLISAATVAQRLEYVLGEEKIEAEPAAIQILAREAAGSMRDAMSLLDQVIAWAGDGGKLTAGAVAASLGVAEQKTLHDIARAVIGGQPDQCLTLVAGLADAGYDVAHVTRDLLSLLRDLVVARVAPDARGLLAVPDAELADLRDIAARASSPDDLTRMHLAFSRASEEILKSPLPRASLEMALVRLSRRPPLLPIDDLLRRLGELEARLEGRAAGRPPERTASRPRQRSDSPDEPGAPFGEPDAPSLHGAAPTALPGPAAFPVAPPAFAAPVAPAFAPPAPTASRAEPPPAAPAARPAFGAPAGAPVFAIPASVLARQAEAEAELDGRGPDSRGPDPRELEGRGPDSRGPDSRGPEARRPDPPRRPEARRPTFPPRGSSEPAAPYGGPTVQRGDPAFARFADFVERVREASSRVGSLLERVALVEASPARLVVVFDPGSFEGQFLTDSAARALMADTCRVLFGAGCAFEVIERAVPAQAHTLAKLVGEANRQRREEAEREVREHPLVAAVVSQLAAEIRDVRLREDTSVLSLRDVT